MPPDADPHPPSIHRARAVSAQCHRALTHEQGRLAQHNPLQRITALLVKENQNRRQRAFKRHGGADGGRLRHPSHPN